MLAGKKFIFLLGTLELGGAERQALHLARYLREQADARVEVWGFGLPGQVSSLCERLNLPWESISLQISNGLITSFLHVLRFAVRLRQAAPHVVLPYTWVPNVVCGMVWRISGAELCIWGQRDKGIWLDPSRFLHRAAVKLTPVFHSNSAHAAQFLMDNFGVARSKIAVIPNGILLDRPVNDRSWWRTRLGASEGDFVGCMVASLGPNKDHQTVVKGWRIVVDELARCGRRALLVFAGRPYGTEREVAALIDELSLRDHVLILGPVDDVAGMLTACDIGVHCAEHEGCPNAVLEEMAAGLAVVGSDVDGVRDVLGEVGADLLAPYGDAHGIAQRILRLASNHDYCASVGEANHQRISSFFNVDTMCRRTVELIVRHLNNKGNVQRLP